MTRITRIAPGVSGKDHYSPSQSPTSRSTGSKRGSRSGARTCSLCGQQGHHRQTCAPTLASLKQQIDDLVRRCNLGGWSKADFASLHRLDSQYCELRDRLAAKGSA